MDFNSSVLSLDEVNSIWVIVVLITSWNHEMSIVLPHQYVLNFIMHFHVQCTSRVITSVHVPVFFLDQCLQVLWLVSNIYPCDVH